MKTSKGKKVKIHIVHSVKGGSGKTAYSLLKSINIAKSPEETKVLYLDADFKGTAIKTLIYGKTHAGFLAIQDEKYFEPNNVNGREYLSGCFVFGEKYVEHTLNDYLKSRRINVYDIIIQGGFLGVNEADTTGEFDIFNEGLIGKIDFIFSSPNMEQKSWFMYNQEDVENPVLALGMYAQRMRKLFRDIKALGYTDIIIDMLPGEDDYSHELLKIIDEENKNDNIEVYFYAITTTDLTHIDAEYEELGYILRTKSKRRPYKRYIVVYNELQKDEFNNVESHCRQLKDMLSDKNSAYLDSVFYTKCEYRKTYYDFCRKNDVKCFDYRLEEDIHKLLEKG